MDLNELLPFWQALPPEQQALLTASAVPHTVAQGALLHTGAQDCTGLLLVASGQLRVFSLSPEGREVTLYRLFARDLCLFSAPCVLHSIRFDVTIAAEQETQLWLIPAERWRALMEASPVVANVTNEIMASRFSEVMWLLEQILWQSMDRRLAALLLEEAALADGLRISLTHEALANHLGTAREVVTRMLRYFQREGLVTLARGSVTLVDPDGLAVLAGQA